jgi:CobQ-like glutamine amidotransferase family enzyme
VLTRRAGWRGIELMVSDVGIGEPVPADGHIYYLGGGQDRDQLAVADDLRGAKGDLLRGVVADGAAMLAVCGGYQLAGHGYTAVDGTRMDGISVLDADTVAGGPPRLIGDVVIDVRLDGMRHTVVGFENHAGRTRLGVDSVPFGTVLSGHGNNGQDGFEGALTNRAIGTYLHGPLLPKNPWLADILLAWGLEHATGVRPQLQPLDDTLEETAHAAAIARARQPNR